MASDFVSEVLVKREKGKKSALMSAGICAGAALIVVAAFVVPRLFEGRFSGLCLLAAAAAVIGAVLLFQRLNVEYEYTFFNNELTVDKIYNQNSRATVAEIPLRQTEGMGCFDPASFNGNDTCIICTADEDGKDGIYIKVPNNVVTLGKNMTLEGSNIIFVLEDTEEVRENLKSSLRASVYREGIKAFN